MSREDQRTVTLDADGIVSIPTVELLTGRGFVTGKSGGGKSNTASVIAEELLADGHPLLIVDTDGEYYGLKEQYEVLHAGAGEECDVQIGTEHADKLAELALEGGVPVILDVSACLDEEGHDLVRATVEALFTREQEARRPFLLLVEEVHEFIPESGGLDSAGEMLIRVAKRGRKRGLGFCGISQRPANVKKDVITQCDWLCWHRLTWDNDTSVVRRVLDGDAATAVQSLDDGEAILVTDWDGSRRRVQVRRKETFDAGATPGLGGVERPDLKSIGDGLLDDLQGISERTREREDRLARLEGKLERKNERIAELEAELDRARDLSDMATQFTRALTHTDGVATDLGSDDGADTTRTERQRDASRDTPGADTPSQETDGADEPTDSVCAETGTNDETYADLLDGAVIRHEIWRAEEHSRASAEYAKGIIATLVDENGPVGHSTILTRLGSSSTDDVTAVATTLESMRIIDKTHTDEGLMVDLNRAGIQEMREATTGRERTRELANDF
ncbi:ATP-binding protein [Halococcus sediminicola]|uniref:ATP-binding protein n=1 Tax=Halococcus sediminicola TaxID=1264579 RepID=UPI000678B19C|nr:DUF87 domain-containing protein [Halococcus sediminicola]